jgi:hypothetical protein
MKNIFWTSYFTEFFFIYKQSFNEGASHLLPGFGKIPV